MKLGERRQRAERIERRQAGPRPGCDHDRIGHEECRRQRDRGAGREASHLTPRCARAGRRIDRHDQQRIAEQEQAQHANPESTAAKDAKQHHQTPARARQFAPEAHEEVDASHHGGGKGDVLGMVEHRAIPDPARRERQRGQQAGARSADGARRRPRRGDSADAGESRQQMPHGIGVKRDDLFEPDRGDIEQTAVEIKILK